MIYLILAELCPMPGGTRMLVRRGPLCEETWKTLIFLSEDRSDLPREPDEDDKGGPGASLSGLTHSLLHDEQWLPDRSPVRHRTAVSRTCFRLCIRDVASDVLLWQRHEPGDLVL